MRNMFMLAYCAAMSLSAANLLENASFEEGAKNWQPGSYIAGAVSAERASDGRHAALFAADNSPKFMALMQNADLKKISGAQMLHVTCDMYIDKFSAGTFYPLYFQIFYGKKIDYVHRIFYPTKTTGEWQQIELWLDLGKYSELKGIKFMSLASAKFNGRIFVDNIKIVPRDRVGEPLVTVPKSSTQWGVLNNFCDSQSGLPAPETTAIAMRHDGKNLYFSCRMGAYALDPVSNQLNLFKSDCRGRDANVWLDDCVELRLTKFVKNTPKDSYYIGFNAANALCDMRLQNGAWQSSWNGDIKLASRREHGAFSAELTVPLADINCDPTDNDAEWRIVAVRFDQRTKSKYVLPGTPADHQSNTGAAVLKFGTGSFAVAPVELSESMAGNEFIPSGSSLGAWTAYSAVNGRIRAVCSGKGDRIKMPLSFFGGTLTLEFADAAGDVKWRTPPLPYSGSSAKMSYDCGKNSAVFHNGVKIGSAGEFVSRNGFNQLAVLIDGRDDFNPQIKSNGEDFSGPAGWRYMANPPAGAEKESFDDRSWPISKNASELPKSGKVMLRRMFLRNVTNFLPSFPDRLWRVSSQGTYQLLWAGGAYATGKLPEHALRDFTLEIVCPDGIALTGAALAPDVAYYIKKAEQPEYFVENPRHGFYRVRVRKQDVTLSAIPGDWLKKLNRSYFGCRLVFAVTGAPGTTGAIKFRAVAADGAAIEQQNLLNFQIMPGLQAPALKHLAVMTYTDLPRLDRQDLHDSLLKTIRDSGINQLVTRYAGESRRKIGLTTTNFFQFNRKYFDAELFKKFPELSGGKYGVLLNPSVLTRNKAVTQVYLNRAVARCLADNPHFDYIWFDYEFAPFPKAGGHNNYLCHGPTGFAAFAKRYNIKEAIDADKAAGKYRREWIEFSCSEVAEMLKMLSTAAAAVNCKFVVYSGYQSAETREHYSIDWKLFGTAIDRADCGYGLVDRRIADTVAAIGGKPLVTGLLKTGIASQSDKAATMFRHAVAGQGGVLLWYENMKDALAWSEVAACVKALAPAEDIIARGKRKDALISVDAAFRDGVAVFAAADAVALTFCNEHDNDRRIKVDATKHLSGRTFRGSDGKDYCADRPFSVTVPAGKALTLVSRK